MRCMLTYIVIYMQIQATKVKRLCETHNSITVNGIFPGPQLVINNGDTLVVKVINRARYNVTIHWYKNTNKSNSRTVMIASLVY